MQNTIKTITPPTKLKFLVATGLLSLGLAGLASAQVTHVYVTGSTAFRNSVFLTLNAASGGVFDSQPTFTGYGNNTAAKCSYMIFSNTIASAPYIIKCEWSGSEAGAIDCVSNILETFPADSLLGAPGSSFATNNPATPPSIDSHQNDIGFVDNNQGYSRSTKPPLTGTEVGVIPFTWVKNAQSVADQSPRWLAWTNLTTALCNVVLVNNGAPLSMFTGNAADTNFVYMAGRNNNSGTRANYLLELGLPVNRFLGQIYITAGSVTDDSVPITLENQAALGLGNGGSTYCGTDGQDSGGTVATTMTYKGSAHQVDVNNPWSVVGSTNDVGWYGIAFLGRSDAATALAGGAVEMLFNGVASTPATIESGLCPLWGNEWIYKSTQISSGGNVVYNKLVAGIPGKLDGVTGIPYSSMSVYKPTSASFPINNNF